MIGHNPTAEPGPEAKPRIPRRRVRRATLALTGFLSGLVCVASIAAIVGLKYFDSQLNRRDIPPLSRYSQGPVNVLVLGSDTREGLSEEEQARKGGPEDVEGQRSDTIILVHLDPGRDEAVIVHFPRDLRVDIPGRGEDKINRAFELGGANLIVRTIQRFTGLDIHHYVEVNFIGFRKVVDALGGVEMCVDRPLFDALAELDIPRAGCYQFDGDTALAFVRARNVEGDVIPDFARISRQQQFIRALLNEVLTIGQFFRLPELIRLAAENVVTDADLTGTDLIYLGRKVKGLAGETACRESSVEFRVVPSVPQDIDGIAYVVAVEPDAGRLFRALENGGRLGDLGVVQVGTEVSPAQIRVRVLDAGSPRQTESAADLLGRAGFCLVGTGEARRDLQPGTVLYRHAREEHAGVVARYFPGYRIAQGPRDVMGRTDVAVVVGSR